MGTYLTIPLVNWMCRSALFHEAVSFTECFITGPELMVEMEWMDHMQSEPESVFMDPDMVSTITYFILYFNKSSITSICFCVNLQTFLGIKYDENEISIDHSMSVYFCMQRFSSSHGFTN